MLNIITEKNDWEKVLEQLGVFDFYHTYDYHYLSKNDGEKPVLLVYNKDNLTIALPLLVRQIFDTDYFDATSVYGYVGPLSNNTKETQDFKEYQNCLNEYFRSNRIIAVFSRLNPYIPQQAEILSGIGEVKPIGNIVNIDLTQSLEQQRSAYRRDTRSRINKARRLCTIRKAESREDIKSFIDIYLETMRKLDANTSYFFDENYFFNFLKCKGFKTDILLAMHNESNKAIAGSMFVKTNDIIQYHLSGTKTEFLNIAPARLLLDEMRLLGSEEKYTYFNLGGGYHSKEDALFNFKSSFSNDIKQFSVWKVVVDDNIYGQLKKDANIGETEFFPAYRAPN
ncbi:MULTISPECIES: GNAT family N-acetyltransferase [unclassified Arenibacter]|jgi:lipid II:glycine glycyltransferase (peptidoglycan interpeptide bridge formation enzyme)|uniref:GNAT family N-acetyltransferase n=1 Tax=unclassified Arenibacter TaxID=2615047 RepID=UPI000E343A2A|nr:MULTISPECIES: GNAT family N-acetyltransferase [unclassified Arenibacter]MCM4164769.1 GNAT family N-acetyltransferase [Arenibacter sp. A80]RFT55837.1 peptidoglycan bridge formation glycyltransferase FemA/FemB family protein [Arenibacter sp. P308M17]